jgi:YjbE family integral membrane protein
MEFGSPQFWIAVLQIIAIDILLGGDNAIVIALACRNLPDRQRRLGIFWGVFGAVGLRVVLTIFAVSLLAIPYLKLIGGLLLLWIGIKLILPEEPGGGHEVAASDSLMGAVKTIIVADFVMSLDNVIAVAAAAKDSWLLIVFGLLVSIPIIVWCSQIILRLMERHPVVITLGGALLGYIAGSMMIRDPVLRPLWQPPFDPQEAHVLYQGVPVDYLAGAAGAALVVMIGRMVAQRGRAAEQRAHHADREADAAADR